MQAAVNAIREKAGDVIEVIGVLDYNFIELSGNFHNENIKHTSLYTFSDILNAAKKYNYFTSDEFEKLLTWINSSNKFNHSKISMCQNN